MQAIEHLIREHRVIERFLERTEIACRDLDVPTLERSVEFFLLFVEGVHHEKEEQVLFPALREWALGPSYRPLHVLMEDHREGRKQLEHARSLIGGHELGGEEAVARLAARIRTYADRLLSHIHREDATLFRLAEQAIPSHADERLVGQMLAAQRQLMQDIEYERWVNEAELAPLKQDKVETMVVRMKGTNQPKGPSGPMDARSLSSEGATEETDGDETRLSSKSGLVLFEEGRHKNLLLHDFSRGLSVQANQFLIIDDGMGMILDPGGPKVYPDVLAQTMLHVKPETLRYIFLSHQDPDIGTSINAWLMDTEADAYISRLWVRFLPHFGIDKLMEERLRPIPDNGLVLELGDSKLVLVPAHFLHSPGNFQVYDPTSKVLFSGDLGASAGIDYTVVTDFDAHTRHMEGFHQRYMGSKAATQAWARTARKLDIECIAPQHGALLKGRPMVERFIDWVSELPCGADLLGQSYTLPKW
jgi:hemerythrin-like domain-containing protein/glyoxylase-like metal-dependent hydrolase (beta-lactamase superfamily II)